MCSHVVIAEDDRQQAELVRRYLEAEQHAARIVPDGQAALDAVRDRTADLLVLDVMLPTLSGLEVCRILRQDSNMPVVMLTARSTEDDLVTGLDVGADDYVTKPFSPRELMARIRTLLRRTGPTPTDAMDVLRVGPLTVDPARHEVAMAGTRIECTPGEFRLLQVMATFPERTLSRSQLLGHLHGFDRLVTTRAIDTHVMNLRRKLEPARAAPVHLLTVYGVGYRLSAGPRGSQVPAADGPGRR